MVCSELAAALQQAQVQLVELVQQQARGGGSGADGSAGSGADGSAGSGVDGSAGIGAGGGSVGGNGRSCGTGGADGSGGAVVSSSSSSSEHNYAHEIASLRAAVDSAERRAIQVLDE